MLILNFDLSVQSHVSLDPLFRISLVRRISDPICLVQQTCFITATAEFADGSLSVNTIPWPQSQLHLHLSLPRFSLLITRHKEAVISQDCKALLQRSSLPPFFPKLGGDSTGTELVIQLLMLGFQGIPIRPAFSHGKVHNRNSWRNLTMQIFEEGNKVLICLFFMDRFYTMN